MSYILSPDTLKIKFLSSSLQIAEEFGVKRHCDLSYGSGRFGDLML